MTFHSGVGRVMTLPTGGRGAGWWHHVTASFSGLSVRLCHRATRHARSHERCVSHQFSDAMQWDPRGAWRIGGSAHFPSISGFVHDVRLFPNSTLRAFEPDSDFHQVTRMAGAGLAQQSLLLAAGAGEIPLAGCSSRSALASGPQWAVPGCPAPRYGAGTLPPRSARRRATSQSALRDRIQRRLFFDAQPPAGRVRACAAPTSWSGERLPASTAPTWMPTCPRSPPSVGGCFDEARGRDATLRHWTEVSARAVNVSLASQARRSLCAAARLHRAAARGGAGESHYHLALAHAAGLGVRRNASAAVAHLLRGAQQGVTLAQMALAFRHRHGLGLPVDPDAAYAYYEGGVRRAVADQANLSSAGHLAEEVYLDNDAALQNNVGQNADMLEYLDYAAANGDARAQADLGHLHYWGAQGVARDVPRAVELLRRGAEGGDAAAQFSLGVMYRNGQGGLPRDNETSFRLFQRAAGQNHSGALNAMGVHYLQEGGNVTKAVEYMEMASAQGSADATFNLANMYRGHVPRANVTTNLTKALETYTRAAKQRHLLSARQAASVGTPSIPRALAENGCCPAFSARIDRARPFPPRLLPLPWLGLHHLHPPAP